MFKLCMSLRGAPLTRLRHPVECIAVQQCCTACCCAGQYYGNACHSSCSTVFAPAAVDLACNNATFCHYLNLIREKALYSNTSELVTACQFLSCGWSSRNVLTRSLPHNCHCSWGLPQVSGHRLSLRTPGKILELLPLRWLKHCCTAWLNSSHKS